MPLLHPRDVYYTPSNYNDTWDTTTAIIVKWVVLGALVLIFALFVVLARMHAKKRLKRSQPPLTYHRWLCSREERARHDPATAARYRQQQQQHNFGFYAHHQHQQQQQQQNGAYRMEAVPPPAYDPRLAPPPAYTVPAGSSKVNPSQQMPGAPPGEEGAGSSRAQEERAADPFRDPPTAPEVSAPAATHAPEIRR